MATTAPPIFKRGPSLIIRLALFSLLSLVLLVADARFRYLERIRAVVSVALYPLQQAASAPGAALDAASEFFVTHADLYQENQQLKRDRLLSVPERQRLLALEAENAHLRKLLDASPVPGRERSLAQILYESHDAFSRKVVIDRGSVHGLHPGQAVVDHLGVVGQVTRVFPLVSEVSLLVDQSQSVPVQNQRSGVRSITYGLGAEGTVELRFLPVNADTREGDVFVTSGIDGIYPPGLPVAVVTQIERKGGAFARVNCRPAAGVSSYNRVAILSDGPPLPPNPLAGGAEAAAPAGSAP